MCIRDSVSVVLHKNFGVTEFQGVSGESYMDLNEKEHLKIHLQTLLQCGKLSRFCKVIYSQVGSPQPFTLSCEFFTMGRFSVAK